MSSRLDVHVGAAMFSKALTVVSWIAPLSLLMWAVRIDVLEGYIYEVPRNFAGDFTAVSSLQVPEWWDGRGMFYGPIFVLEARYLVIPHVLSRADFARADFLLFGLAFVFVWAALIGRRHPRLTLWLLAAWLAHQATVQAFANTAHLEVLELALLGAALLFAVRGQRPHAGGLLGLATATKTLPVLFIPYLAIRREWSMLAWACFAGGSVFLVACWVLAIAPWEGLAGLAYQRGNLTGLEFTSYHYALRSDFARVLAQGRETLAPDQVSLAVALHWIVTAAAILFGVWAIARSRAAQPRYGLIFGLVLALMLIVAPSVHLSFFIFLLPAWTAVAVELLRRPLSGLTWLLWFGLVAAYVMTGFDQPFFLLQRVFGFGLVIPQQWLSWHLPTIGLFFSLLIVSTCLLTGAEVESGPRRTSYGARLSRVLAFD